MGQGAHADRGRGDATDLRAQPGRRQIASRTSGAAPSPVTSRSAISAQEVTEVLPARTIELFSTGAPKFARLKEDMAEAQRFIHLQYFIWEKDELTAE